MVGNEGSASSLTEGSDQVLMYGFHKKYKKLSDEKLKICAKRVGFTKLGYRKLGYFK